MKFILRLTAIFAVLFGFDIVSLNTDKFKEAYYDVVDYIYDMDVFHFLTNTGGGCSGMWISQNTILTARHCVTSTNEDPKKPFKIRIRDGKYKTYTVSLGLQGIPVTFSPSFWDSFSILRVKKGPRKYRRGIRVAKEIGGPLLLKCFPYKKGYPALHRDVIYHYSVHWIQRGSVIIAERTGGGGCSGGGLFNLNGELVGITIWGIPTALGKKSVFYNMVPYANQINRRIRK